MATEISHDIVRDVSNKSHLPYVVVKNVVDMLDKGNTVPFISRYRKEKIQGLEPEKVHEIRSLVDHFKEVYLKANNAIKKLKEKGALNNELQRELMDCKTSEDVEIIMESYRETKKTLAQKACEANIDKIVDDMINSKVAIDLNKANLLTNHEDFNTPASLEEGILCILSDIISKNINVTKFAKLQLKSYPPKIFTNMKKEARKVEDHMKYSKYFNFFNSTTKLFPHTILAINRAESKNVITVRFDFHPKYISTLNEYIFKNLFADCNPKNRFIFNKAVDRSISKSLIPKMIRYTRSEMMSFASDVSVDIFKSNLRRLLMAAPLTTSSIDADAMQEIIMSDSNSPGDRLPVIGIDPGFTHGCKWAAVDAHGSLLAYGVFYPYKPESQKTLFETINIYQINILGIGNGQGCREVEEWVIKSKQNNLFNVSAKLLYCFVSENGASIYSASALAKQELPNIDVTIRGAISIARRLQDPMAELVKIEPQHLGVGMYQHDLKKTQLNDALDAVVEECISFVGIDANTAPMHILQKIAGLGPKKASAIIEYRKKTGGFKSRNDLKKVPGIGPQTFAQISGFLRIKPKFLKNEVKYSDEPMIDLEYSLSEEDENFNMIDLTEVDPYIPPSKKRKLKPTVLDPDSFNPLDQTAVHPMTYEVTTRLIESLRWSISDVGRKDFIARMDKLYKSSDRDETLRPFCNEEFGLETLRDIIKTLSRPLNFDERPNQFAPLFRDNPPVLKSLKKNDQVRGYVINVTTFGAFVDIGFPMPSLLMDAERILKIYDRVLVTIEGIDKNKIMLKPEYKII